MVGVIGIDFETYSDVDLKRFGLDNYVNSPAFRPLICSIATTNKSNGSVDKETFDFVLPNTGRDRAYFEDYLRWALLDNVFSAHNSGFEKAVLRWMNPRLAADMSIRDSAVIARIQGGTSHLAQCAPQLLNKPKMDEGIRLIRKFCVPRSDGTALIDDPDWRQSNDPDWLLFKQYCERDAELSYEFEIFYGAKPGSVKERDFENTTAKMNQKGWPVDVDSVKLMLQRSEWNKAEALRRFRAAYDPKGELNLNSLKQMKDWCRARGIQAKSFNEENVESMITKIRAKLDEPAKLTHGVLENYSEVLEMLLTKQTIGGSSLKKLPVILNLTGKDNRLRNQYMHCGAGQTYRTSGTGAQMQNLKRLREIRDMDTLADPNVTWTNDDLAENIRQCFTASGPKGQLIVGDFSSVESRGLAYLAGEEWKLAEYRKGKDMYKVLAEKIFSVGYDDVVKSQRQTGKVGELSCGYGAGPDAVVSFANGMGVAMTPEEALQLVRDWRAANPMIVKLWETLDSLLHIAVNQSIGVACAAEIGYDLKVEMHTTKPPASLEALHPGAVSIVVRLVHRNRDFVLERVFHGCYARGNGICYYKPAETKTGELWKAWYIDPKSKQRKFYSIYGGKMAGILTQSFCRELFFMVLQKCRYLEMDYGVDVIGQFHDEIVVDWNPDQTSSTLGSVVSELEMYMSDPGPFSGFPLVAEVKHDYRYTK